jgi:hypothetical protein
MYYVSAGGQIFDDGYGMNSSPAYGIDDRGARYELAPPYAAELTQRFAKETTAGRLPIGNAIARVTKAVGMKPCTPCARRQAALNGFGDAVAQRLGFGRERGEGAEEDRTRYWWE